MNTEKQAESSLGPQDAWPQSLQSALSICFNCQFPIAIYWGPDRLLFYNESWRPIVGNKHPGSYGKPAREVWPEIWDVIDPLFTAVEKTGRGQFNANQLLLMHRFGYTEECYFDFTFSPIKEPDGTVGGIFNAVLETTFRTLSERRSKTLSDLTAQATSAPTTVDICRLAAEVLAENPTDVPFSAFYAPIAQNQFENLELVASSGLVGSGPAQLQGTFCLSLVARAMRTGMPEKIEGLTNQGIEIVGRAWPDKVESFYVLPIPRPGGPGLRALGALILGINPRRMLDAEYEHFIKQVAAHVASGAGNAYNLQQEKKRVEALGELDRAKTVFFSNVSHEFRTPLTLMLGPMEDLLNGAYGLLTEKQIEQIKLQQRNGLRLLKLVNSLLDFSRIEAGRTKANLEAVDLGKLTADIASVFRSAIEKAGLEFHVDTPSLSEAFSVDREMWEKIVLNLLSNALKFTFQGAIQISLRKNASGAELCVLDSGTGIPEAELPHVFERFRRVEGAKGRTHEGSGIGLALVQELVKLHGGQVAVASEIGKGSKFTVQIPLSGMQLRPGQETLAAPEGVASAIKQDFIDEAERWMPQEESSGRRVTSPENGRSSSLSNGREKRILIADDNADLRLYLKNTLSKNWQVEVVENGAKALAAALFHPPDLILSDVMMPELDGFGLLDALKKNDLTKTIPVILLSARAGEDSKVEGLESGADDYLIKPFSAKELVARVRTHLKIADLRNAADIERSRLYSLLMQAPVAVCVTEGSSHIYSLTNPLYLDMCGARENDLIGKPVGEALPEARDQGFEKLLDEVYRSGTPYIGKDVPLQIRNADGSVRNLFVDFIYHAKRGLDGKIDGILTVATDVTEKVHAMKDLIQMKAVAENAKGEAEKANELKSAFLANMSHEIRTPLGAILGFTDVLKNSGTSTTERNQYLEIIDRNGQALTRIIDDILDLSKIEAGKLSIENSPICLKEIIQDVIVIFSDRASAKGIRLTFDAGKMPEFKVDSDAARIRQILVNLIGNAIKFTTEGSVTIHGRFSKTADGFVAVSLFVTDTGIGMTSSQASRIFKPFTQGDNTSTRKYGGTGLGLALSRKLSQALGGNVTLEDYEDKKGCTFRFDLLTKVSQNADSASVAGGEADPVGLVRKIEGMKILVVDDSPDNRALINLMLKKEGALVKQATDGAEGVQMALAEDFDAVLLDIQMPGLDGYEALATLKGRNYKKPVIALTAHAMKEERDRAIASGFDDHIAKPVNKKLLIESLGVHVKNRIR